MAWRRSWVTSATATPVAPIAPRRSSESISCARASRSSKGSSRSSTAGSRTKACASATRRISPPERVLPRRPASPSRPKCASARSARRRRCARGMPAPQSGSATFHATEPESNKGRWKTIATVPLVCATIWPRSGASRPPSARSSVLLPAPFGPRTASTSPAWRSSASISRAKPLSVPPRRSPRAPKGRTRSSRASSTTPLIDVLPAAAP